MCLPNDSWNRESARSRGGSPPSSTRSLLTEGSGEEEETSWEHKLEKVVESQRALLAMMEDLGERVDTIKREEATAPGALPNGCTHLFDQILCLFIQFHDSTANFVYFSCFSN